MWKHVCTLTAVLRPHHWYLALVGWPLFLATDAAAAAAALSAALSTPPMTAADPGRATWTVSCMPKCEGTLCPLRGLLLKGLLLMARSACCSRVPPAVYLPTGYSLPSSSSDSLSSWTSLRLAADGTCTAACTAALPLLPPKAPSDFPVLALWTLQLRMCVRPHMA